MKVVELNALLRAMNLPVSGNKPDKVDRLCLCADDSTKLQKILELITPRSQATPFGALKPRFQILPFYECIRELHSVCCPPNKRNTMIEFSLTAKDLENTDYQIVILMAPVEAVAIAAYSKTFALLNLSSIEMVSVGNKQLDVKHLVVGLQSKPGTMHPLDITQLCALSEGLQCVQVYFQNVKYMDSDKHKVPPSLIGNMLSVFLVRKIPASFISSQIGYKPKEKRQNEIINEANLEQQKNKEFQISNLVDVSTLDTMSFDRIKTPVRSKKCTHYECFDANVFLDMNLKISNFTCPVCSRMFGVVDDYGTLPSNLQQFIKSPLYVGVDPISELYFDCHFLSALELDKDVVTLNTQTGLFQQKQSQKRKFIELSDSSVIDLSSD